MLRRGILAFYCNRTPPNATNCPFLPGPCSAVSTTGETLLRPCPRCSRNFLAERIESHLRSCQINGPSAQGPLPHGADAAAAGTQVAHANHAGDSSLAALAALSYDEEFSAKLSELHGLLQRAEQ